MFTLAKQKSKTPPPPIGYHNGKPILAGTLGKLIDGCRTITVICPRCGKKNRHGWPANSRDDQPSHRAGHCDCWNEAPSGYYIVPAAESGEVEK